MLNQFLEEADNKGLSANKICKLCQADGVDLQPTYLSEVRNNPSRRMSDEKSRAVARACGKPEDWLVTQARLDNSSETLNKVYSMLYESVAAAAKASIQKLGHPELAEKAQMAVNAMPKIEFFQKASEIDMSSADIILDGVFPNLSLEGFLDRIDLIPFPVQDNGMSDKFPNGSKVMVKKCNYKDGDFICYLNPDNKAYCVRQVRFLNIDHTQIMLIPHSSTYLSETFNINEILICGKVKRLIVDFE